MNKEEKRINYLLDTIIECPSMQADELRKRIRRLFKTIEKQQKENEKLKKKRYILNAETGEIKEIPIDENYISKDKIKEEIKELEKEIEEKQEYGCDFTLIHEHEIDTNAIIRVLKELLGEEK